MDLSVKVRAVVTVAFGLSFLSLSSLYADDSVTSVGAGDIADCASGGDEATVKLLDDIPGTVFTAGDNAYRSGLPSEFESCYGPSWGRHEDRTKPVPGNHEYKGGSYAEGYFDYFGEKAGEPGEGWYSYDLGDWHVAALNSNCEKVGGYDEGSPQLEWLREDLRSSDAGCTLVYWHHPLFSSGHHGGSDEVKPLWDALYQAGAEVVVNGHDHAYERFSPQTPEGEPDPHRGLREFVVGTGGKSLYSLEARSRTARSAAPRPMV